MYKRQYRFYDKFVFSKIRRAVGVENGNIFPTAGAPLSDTINELLLIGGIRPETVELETPSGQKLFLEVEDIREEEGRVSCAIRKDSGDDPDVTLSLIHIWRNGPRSWGSPCRYPSASAWIRLSPSLPVLNRLPPVSYTHLVCPAIEKR